MVKRWSRRLEAELLRTPIFGVHTHVGTSPRTGKDHPFYVLDFPDWVNVIALPDPDHVLMVEQYRHGVDGITLEIPGGVVDSNDTSPAAAAKRELQEETGWRAGKLELLGSTVPNPALQNNVCYSFLATELQDTGRVELDCAEDIAPCRIPLREIPSLIQNGTITHALVIVAFYQLEHYSRRMATISRSRTSSA